MATQLFHLKDLCADILSTNKSTKICGSYFQNQVQPCNFSNQRNGFMNYFNIKGSNKFDLVVMSFGKTVLLFIKVAYYTVH